MVRLFLIIFAFASFCLANGKFGLVDKNDVVLDTKTNADSTKMTWECVHRNIPPFQNDSTYPYTTKIKIKSGKFIVDTIIKGIYRPARYNPDSLIFSDTSMQSR
jgi:hypothetical protein